MFMTINEECDEKTTTSEFDSKILTYMYICTKERT